MPGSAELSDSANVIDQSRLAALTSALALRPRRLECWTTIHRRGRKACGTYEEKKPSNAKTAAGSN